MSGPVTEELRAAFQEIDSRPLRPDTILMRQDDFEDIVNWAVCEECGGSYDKREGGHPGPGCDLERVREVMES